MKAYSYQHPDKEILLESSSGGLFSALACKVLQAGGVVYGAAFDENWGIYHQRIDNVQNLSLLRGSKYVFSRYQDCIHQLQCDLAKGITTLFSGTPCQVAAIRKRFGEHSHLILLEVVCHGAPEAKYWNSYLAEVCAHHHRDLSDIKSINFRDKRTGWKNYSFTIVYKDGKIFTETYCHNLYMRAFLSNLTLREGCFKCPFKYPDGSQADLTLGDFWGISRIAPDIDNDFGTTMVIVRTPVGGNLYSGIEDRKIFTLDQVSKYNPAITNAPGRNENRDRFLDSLKHNQKLIPVLKKYADIPMKRKICLKIANLRQRILKR